MYIHYSNTSLFLVFQLHSMIATACQAAAEASQLRDELMKFRPSRTASLDAPPPQQSAQPSTLPSTASRRREAASATRSATAAAASPDGHQVQHSAEALQATRHSATPASPSIHAPAATDDDSGPAVVYKIPPMWYDIDRHVDSPHYSYISATRSYHCRYQGCDFQRKSTATARSHIRGHFRMRKFMCPCCKKEYKDPQTCKEHIRVTKPEAVVVEDANFSDYCVSPCTLD